MKVQTDKNSIMVLMAIDLSNISGLSVSVCSAAVFSQ
jgi:hypothetical protein